MDRSGGVPCPVCGCRERDIIETRFRKRTASVYRRSSCHNCGERFSTQECLIGMQRPDAQSNKRQVQEALFRIGHIERNLALLKRTLPSS